MIGNKNLKPKKKRMNTPNILQNNNARMIAAQNLNLKNNRPRSKYILGNRKKSKDNLLIQMNNNNKKKIKLDNLNVIFNNKNIKKNNNINILNININAQKNFKPEQLARNIRKADSSEQHPLNRKKIFLGKGNNGKKEIKNNLINFNNNNIYIDNFSKS